MTGLQSVVRLAALGSAMIWSTVGWAQQETDKPNQDDQAQREPNAAPEKKSSREKSSARLTPAEESLKKQAEELSNSVRRLNRARNLHRERPMGRIEFQTHPFRFNVQGDWYFSEPRPNDLGMSVVPAEESLRTQLGLPDGQGLIVKSVAHGGPAFRIGLQVNDVLTSLGDKPLTTPADLVKQLKEAGEKPVPLQVLRSGKSMSIQVKPEYHVSFGPVETTRPRYQLGVQVASLDDTLRAQLKVADQEGLLVSAVEPGSAAEKAGLKKYDILLAAGDQSLKSPEDLVNQIQNSSGKALTFKLLRGGKTITLEVTPAILPDDESSSLEHGLAPSLRAVRPSGLVLPQNLDAAFPGHRPQTFPFPTHYDPLWRQQPGNFHSSEPELGELQGEVTELRRLIEKLQKSLQAQTDSDHSER
ncbi:serine protease Do [Singulisphaera sp. GP187]|uniref:PDZ domain-containing protein n=1 Tax=Singulisphaera sp. GP187 TaxID=1882752 RepID=UPI000925B7EA|nr:PDZ domain-containing protein [Singulisphaera sp. GP187]SIO01715.1 serine protease Do [Singulisphaera sp. GP187]